MISKSIPPPSAAPGAGANAAAASSRAASSFLSSSALRSAARRAATVHSAFGSGRGIVGGAMRPDLPPAANALRSASAKPTFFSVLFERERDRDARWIRRTALRALRWPLLPAASSPSPSAARSIAASSAAWRFHALAET